jgi:NitT/TauT family transport system ATP-binding protein
MRFSTRLVLSEFGRHYPAQLSGGMQQRVGLARVLVNKPRVMLMDEPFSSLDAQTRLMMQELLLEVWTEYGMTVLFVTHDIDEAIYLGSQVAVLTRRPGRLKALFDVPLPRPRTIDTLVSKDFMKLKRTCMDLLREEMLGAPAATERRGRDSNLPRDRLLVESADVAA